MKKILALLLLLSLSLGCLFLFSCGKGGVSYVEIKVKDYGSIIVKVDSSIAPVTVENFLSLVNSGSYDGLTFHRIISNFMIQGGDPKANGTGSGPHTIQGEFAENGFKNTLSHKRGVISMSRANDPNSASCQFFICNADSTFLDGKYAAFGYVVEGMEVVDAITAELASRGDPTSGLVPRYLQPEFEYIKVLDDYTPASTPAGGALAGTSSQKARKNRHPARQVRRLCSLSVMEGR